MVTTGKLNNAKTQAECWSVTLRSVKLLLQFLTLILALLPQSLPRKGSRVVRAGTVSLGMAVPFYGRRGAAFLMTGHIPCSDNWPQDCRLAPACFIY